MEIIKASTFIRSDSYKNHSIMLCLGPIVFEVELAEFLEQITHPSIDYDLFCEVRYSVIIVRAIYYANTILKV